MSKTTKRKHVMKELFDDEYDLPKDNQRIVRILKSKGNNLHEITTPEDETYLVSMPTKFRKNIWVKRGDYVIVEPISEGDKVKGEIVRILSNESIKYFKENNVWPEQFADHKEADKIDNDIFVNPNRVNVNVSEESSSSDSDDS